MMYRRTISLAAFSLGILMASTSARADNAGFLSSCPRWPDPAAEASVLVEKGHIVEPGRAGVIPGGGSDSDPVPSPDGHTIAFVRRVGPETDDRTPSEVMLVPSGGGAPRRAVADGPRPDWEGKGEARSLRCPKWSADGRHVYVLAAAYVTTDEVVEIDLATGRQRGVIDGNSLALIRSGPWRGCLLVRRHKYFHSGEGSYDPVDVVRPDGRVVATVPGSARREGSDLTARWLRTRGWKVALRGFSRAARIGPRSGAERTGPDWPLA